MAKREYDEGKKVQRCCKCGEWKSFDEFVSHKGMKFGIDTTCSQCNRKKANKYYIENKEEKKEYQKQYYKKHKIKRMEYGKRYCNKNKEKLKEWYKKYEKEPKRVLSRSVSRAKRRFKLERFNTDITAEFLNNLWEETNICEICGKELINKKEAHLDHIFPLCIGGEHMTYNLRYICSSCNLKRPRDGRDLTRKKAESPEVFSFGDECLAFLYMFLSLIMFKTASPAVFSCGVRF